MAAVGTTARRHRSRFLTHVAGDTPDGSHRYARLRRHQWQSDGTHDSAADFASDPTSRGTSEAPQPDDEADKRTPGCHRAGWGVDPGAGSPDRGSRRENAADPGGPRDRRRLGESDTLALALRPGGNGPGDSVARRHKPERYGLVGRRGAAWA